jgi:RNA polymerase sigma factor (sigma-70 family)
VLNPCQPLSPGRADSDRDLLAAFARAGSEDAFQRLVEKYLGLVYPLALRRTGQGPLAEEIAQNVFLVLARKAKRLSACPTLSGWLYRATMIESAEALRRERRHRDKINHYTQFLEAERRGEPRPSMDLLLLLDQALARLPASDRDVILLRFFEGKAFRDIGAALGKSEAASQKQMERALAKIGRYLERHRSTTSTAALVAALSAFRLEAVPVGLSLAIVQSTLQPVAHFAVQTFILKTIDAMTLTKSRTAALVALTAAIPLFVQWKQIQSLRSRLDATHVRAASVAQAEPGTKAMPAPMIESPAPSLPATAVAVTEPVVTQSFSQRWRLALLEPDPVRRAVRLAKLLDELTAENAPMAAQAFDQVQAEGLNFKEEKHLFYRAWGKVDGWAAVQHAMGAQRQPNHSPELLAALGGWASAQPFAAQGWVETLPEGGLKEDIIYGLLDGWSMVDFAGAAAYAESRPRSQARERFQDLLLNRSLAAGGVPAAQTWFERIPDDEHNKIYKEHAFDRVMQVLLFRDPSGAAYWISQHSGQPYVSGETVTQTARKLAETSPSGAIDWLTSLNATASGSYRGGLSDVMKSWAKSDPVAAGAWLGQNMGNAYYDDLAGRFARQIATVSPETALSWAATISDETARSQGLNKVAGAWLSQEPDNAAAALRAEGWTDDMLNTAKNSYKVAGLDGDVQLAVRLQDAEYWSTARDARVLTAETLAIADPNSATHVSFSPVGRAIVTSDGNAVRIWDVKTGQPVLSP